MNIHDDIRTRNQWKLAVSEDLKRVYMDVKSDTVGEPTRLYPLEVSADEYSLNGSTGKSTRLVSTGKNSLSQQQPTKRTVIRARD